MHALLTGATGLLGRHLTAELLDRQWTVTAIVRKNSDRRPIQLPGVAFHVCDLAREPLDPAVVRTADVVFHAAAAVTDWAPWSDYVANTIEATRRVTAAMLAAGCRRLVHISTVGVYGRPRVIQPLTEDQPYSSIGRWDYYSNSKIAAERIVWEQQRHQRLTVTVFRPAMIYGPSAHGLIARVAGYLRRGHAALVGDPTVNLPLIHVRDVAAAVVLAANHPAAAGEAFNLVNPEPVTQSDFFNTVAMLTDTPPVVKQIPYRVAYAAGFLAEISAHLTRSTTPPCISRYRVSLFGHPRDYAISKAQTVLHWQPQIAFNDGIRQTIAALNSTV